MAQPQTRREKSDIDGRDCIHFQDEDEAVLQIHHRGDQPTGFILTSQAVVRLVPGFAELVRVDVYVTHAQAQELCDYFRNVL